MMRRYWRGEQRADRARRPARSALARSAALLAVLLPRAAGLSVPTAHGVWLPAQQPGSAADEQGAAAAAADAAHGAKAAASVAAGATIAASAPQCFDWSLKHSVALGSFAFPAPSAADGTANVGHAEPGDIIPLQCDSVICPNPPVRDCYMSDANACAADEWCRLEDHIKFGPFAMVHGETPNNIAYETCADLSRGGFTELFAQVCGGVENWGPWLSVRGRCERFRAEEESCNAQLAFGADAAAFTPQYVTAPDGRPPRAALVCGPGLTCTGDFAPLPHTCVRARPPDVCYQGPWWDSSWCKVGGAAANDFQRGLPREELERIAPALLLQLPTEIFHNPEAPVFWASEAADRARAAISAIVAELWPEAYRRDTRFPLATFPDPRLADGVVYSAAWNATAAEARVLYRQSNKIWSLIHTLMANTADPMRTSSVDASRALAVWLRQHFMCTNCRGFWGNLVVNEMGLPPDSTSRRAHVRWWYDAHNAVSEHTAATRGGHPWVYPRMPRDAFAQRYGGLNPKLACQNPFFLPFEHVERMWTISVAPA